MALTRAQLRTEVINNTGRSDSAFVTRINQALDIAIQELSTQHLWTDLQTTADVSTSSGSQTVSLASDLARLVEVRVIDGVQSYRLHIRPKLWVTRQFSNPNAYSSMKPVWGYLEGKTLYLAPVPDAVYTLRYTYYKVHPAFSGDGDSSVIRGSDQTIIAYATFWIFQQTELHENAEKWLMSYLRLLNSLKTLDSSNYAELHQADQRGTQPTLYNPLDPFQKGEEW